MNNNNNNNNNNGGGEIGEFREIEKTERTFITDLGVDWTNTPRTFIPLTTNKPLTLAKLKDNWYYKPIIKILCSHCTMDFREENISLRL
jgi:hypothetical protein